MADSIVGQPNIGCQMKRQVGVGYNHSMDRTCIPHLLVLQ
jgi:hypothetical protein